MAQRILTIPTHGPGLHEFTDEARDFVRAGAGREGGGSEGPGGEALLTVFVRHTSCSLLIGENADGDVRRDLLAYLRRLAPPADDPSMTYLVHRAEGPDDMPAHLKAALLPTSLGVPVRRGELLLGTWQGLFLIEHRDRPHRREVVLHLSG